MEEQLADLRLKLPWVVTRLSEIGYPAPLASDHEKNPDKKDGKLAPEEENRFGLAATRALLPQSQDVENVLSNSQGSPGTPPSMVASGHYRAVDHQDKRQTNDTQSLCESGSSTTEVCPWIFPPQISKSLTEPWSEISEAHAQAACGQTSPVDLQPAIPNLSGHTVPQESSESLCEDFRIKKRASPVVSVHSRPSSDSLSAPGSHYVPSPGSLTTKPYDSGEVTYEVWSLVYQEPYTKESESSPPRFDFMIVKGVFSFTKRRKERVPGSYRFIQIRSHSLKSDSVLHNSSSTSITQSIRLLPLIAQEAVDDLLWRRSIRKPSVAAVDIGETPFWYKVTGRKIKRPSLTIYLACEASSPPLDSCGPQSACDKIATRDRRGNEPFDTMMSTPSTSTDSLAIRPRSRRLPPPMHFGPPPPLQPYHGHARPLPRRFRGRPALHHRHSPPSSDIIHIPPPPHHFHGRRSSDTIDIPPPPPRGYGLRPRPAFGRRPSGLARRRSSSFLLSEEEAEDMLGGLLANLDHSAQD
ncbi:MAG: hypothetical protein Q9160_003430 [Pyrenula sp. 1 TL-2023]